MNIQYAVFKIPVYHDSIEQEELNRFLRGHKIIQTRKEIVILGENIFWSFLVEYLENQSKNENGNVKPKVDYKEILSTEDFSLFSKLREIRKKLAEENGLPVYAVFTNEQLAEFAKRRPCNITECMKIDGIGQAKADKYLSAILLCLNSNVV